MDLIKECDELIKLIWPSYSYTGWPIFTAFLSIIVTIGKTSLDKLKSNKTRRILKKFTKEEVRKHNRFYISHLGVSPDINDNEPFKIIKYFKKQVFPIHDTNKHYIILGDSGTGKTSLLINLVLRSTKLIRFWRRYNLVLIPIRSISNENDIAKVVSSYEPEQTILLLDGLDEDKIARDDIDSRLQQLYEWTVDFRKIIITCRTQFFSSDNDFPRKTTVNYYTEGGGYFKFKHIFIQPFNRRQVKKFLRKKYRIWKIWRPLNVFKREVSKKLVFNFPDINRRPLLLSYINDLLPPNKNILKITIRIWGLMFINLFNNSKSSIFKRITESLEKSMDQLYSQSAYSTKTKVYRTIIKKWIVRESERVREEKERNMHQSALFRLALFASKLIYTESRDNNKLSIAKSKLFDRAIKENLNLDNIDISSRSLLFRNSEGEFIFAHKSILEYFLAIYATHDANLNRELHDQNGWDNFVYFFREIMMVGKIFPYLQETEGKVSLQYRKDGPFVPTTDDLTIERIEGVTSIKITGDIGYIDSNLFYVLGNLSIDTYLNIAEYLVYKQHYCYEEISGFLNILNSNNDENYTILKRTINIYEYLREYRIAALYMEKYIELKDIFFQYPEHEKLIEFYLKAEEKEKYLPLREKFFKQLTAKHFRHYFYINDLYKSGFYNEAISAYLQFDNEFEYKTEVIINIISCYLATDNFEEAIFLYRQNYSELNDISLAVSAFSSWFEKHNELDKCLEFIEEEITKLSGEKMIEMSMLYAKQLAKKDIKKANDYVQQLSIKHHSEMIFIEQLVQYYRKIDDHDSAIQAALVYAEKNPEDFRPYNQVAICYSDMGDNELCIQYYKLSIEKFKSPQLDGYLQSIVLHNLADKCNSLSLYDEAIKYYKRAIELTDESRIRDYTWDLAECYEGSLNYENAFYCYRQLWARFHSLHFLSKAIDNSVNTKELRHVVKMYTLLDHNKGWIESEKVNSSRARMIDYLIGQNILEEKEGEFRFRTELYHNYYDGLSKLFLEN